MHGENSGMRYGAVTLVFMVQAAGTNRLRIMERCRFNVGATSNGAGPPLVQHLRQNVMFSLT